MRSDSESDSQTDGVTLLAVGDVHLGTRPARLPSDLADYWAVDPLDLTPEAALGAVVDRAISEQVDAVLFAGDVVESTNARYEAVRPLESCVRRLQEAEIPVLAVVGNHDVEALPRLAGLIEGLVILGQGGKWESHLIEKHGRPALEIFGWSFPGREVRASPVAELLRANPRRRQSVVPRLGVLHGDLDASGGPYAPFSRREVEAAGFDAWLLGHIHRPSLGDSSGVGGALPCGYLGSLVGLDPSETGPHGPWLIHVDGGGRVVPEHLPMAPLRWERLDVVVEPAERPDDLGDRLLDRTERFAREIQEGGCIPRALGVRVRLVGSAQRYDEIRRWIDAGEWNRLSRAVGDTVVFVEKLIDGLELAVNLEEMAAGDDPPSLLARKLLILEQGGEAARALLSMARGELRSLVEDVRWRPLEEIRAAEDPLSDAALGALLKRAGTAALYTLLSQNRAGGGDRS